MNSETKYGWLSGFGIVPSYEPSQQMIDNLRFALGKAGMDPSQANGMVTTPGLAGYCAPMIREGNNLAQVAEHVTASFRGLIADIWTQILVSKRDAKEKQLYLMWDDEIPVPTEETALAWLLTCESWPMPRHRPMRDTSTNDSGLMENLFPPQSFVMPQSTQLGHASNQPIGYARGHTYGNDRSLNGLFTHSLNREDREKMALIENQRTAVHRPRTNNFTCYELHCNGDSHEQNIAFRWSTRGAWPKNPTQAMDQNLGAYELQESDYHLLALDNLRTSVMRNVISTPGIPTCRHNLYHPPGMHIRAWSQQNLAVKNVDALTTPGPLPWSEEADRIQLGAGGYLNTIPLAAPRVWFGFTSMGPKLVDEHTATPALPTSSESWVAAYRKHRSLALTQLFYPERITIRSIVADATSARAKRLSRAGRIKKTQEQSAFAAAFNSIVKESK